MSVMSFLERRLIRTCRTLKRPRKNWPVWVLRFVSAALRTLTRPRLVSSVEPTGIVSAPSSFTKPLGGLACDVLAEPAGSFTKTSPETTVAFTVLNGTGFAAPLLWSTQLAMPSLSVSPPMAVQGSPGGGVWVTVTGPDC